MNTPVTNWRRARWIHLRLWVFRALVLMQIVRISSRNSPHPGFRLLEILVFLALIWIVGSWARDGSFIRRGSIPSDFDQTISIECKIRHIPNWACRLLFGYVVLTLPGSPYEYLLRWGTNRFGLPTDAKFCLRRQWSLWAYGVNRATVDGAQLDVVYECAILPWVPGKVS